MLCRFVAECFLFFPSFLFTVDRLAWCLDSETSSLSHDIAFGPVLDRLLSQRGKLVLWYLTGWVLLDWIRQHDRVMEHNFLTYSTVLVSTINTEHALSQARILSSLVSNIGTQMPAFPFSLFAYTNSSNSLLGCFYFLLTFLRNTDEKHSTKSRASSYMPYQVKVGLYTMRSITVSSL